MAALTCGAAALPASAFAAPGAVPPGNSGANQYTETLPGPGGNQPTRDVDRDTNPAKALGKRNAARLEALGPEGEAAAALAAATTTSSGAGSGGGASADRAGAGHRGAAGGAGGSSGLGQVVGQITGASSDSGGMGLLLPLLIVASVLAAAGYAVGRRRTARPRG